MRCRTPPLRRVPALGFRKFHHSLDQRHGPERRPRASAKEIDARLHQERISRPGRAKRIFEAPVDHLPDGIMIARRGIRSRHCWCSAAPCIPGALKGMERRYRAGRALFTYNAAVHHHGDCGRLPTANPSDGETPLRRVGPTACLSGLDRAKAPSLRVPDDPPVPDAWLYAVALPPFPVSDDQVAAGTFLDSPDASHQLDPAEFFRRPFRAQPYRFRRPSRSRLTRSPPTPRSMVSIRRPWTSRTTRSSASPGKVGASSKITPIGSPRANPPANYNRHP